MKIPLTKDAVPQKRDQQNLESHFFKSAVGTSGIQIQKPFTRLGHPG
jgi:hypothetical protein